MATISLIFSGLALLAACYSLALNVRNEKRNQKRNAALINYVDKQYQTVNRNFDAWKKTLIDRIEQLEKGVMPDYEQAKAAADAVNDFNRGISNILGFDPHEALIASRRKEGEGE